MWDSNITTQKRRSKTCPSIVGSRISFISGIIDNKNVENLQNGSIELGIIISFTQ